jgi:excisionase family DNA binding protein
MLTVPEAARRVGRDPETVRRWIRAGKLRARKVGTQHVIDEGDLDRFSADEGEELPYPDRLRYFESGRPQPNWTADIRRLRRER